MIEVRVRGANRLGKKNAKLSIYARGKYSSDVVDDGYQYARSRAPKDTRALMKAIVKENKKRSAKLVLYQPRHRDGRKRPYHMWMHGIPAPVRGADGGGVGYNTSRGKYRPTSGNPMFMFKAFEIMKKKSTERFKKKVQQIY